MTDLIAKTKNVDKLAFIYESLLIRNVVPKQIGLVLGASGTGKTTAALWLVKKVDAIYVKATVFWEPISLIREISNSIGLRFPRQFNQVQALNMLVEQLQKTKRPLFVDEIDFFWKNHDVIKTLQDIHARIELPILLFGENVDINSQPALGRLISQQIEFCNCDFVDAKLLADCCEIQITEDSLKRIHEQSRGNPRLMLQEFQAIEAYKLNKKNEFN